MPPPSQLAIADRHADDHHVDHGERGDRLDIAGLVEIVDRDRERDRARREQQDRRRQLLDHRHEHQQPAGEQAGPDQRQRDLAHGGRPGGAENLRAFLQRGIDLAQRGVGGAHAERDVAPDIGQQQDRQRAVERDRHREPELDQRHRHHDAGQPERNERGVVEQLAARDAGAQVDPADHRAEQHRDAVAATVASIRLLAIARWVTLYSNRMNL